MEATEDPPIEPTAATDRAARLAMRARSGSEASFLARVDTARRAALDRGDPLPQVLYLSVLQGLLTRSPAGTATLPYTLDHDDRAEIDDQLRQITTHWRSYVLRHLFVTPADLVRALPPPAPAPGHPHSLARVMRTFVTHLAATHRHTATALADLIDDPGEAVAAQCALVRAALEHRDLDGEATSWARARHLITRMPVWRWRDGSTTHDREALAYLRPDHRARFDTAVDVLTFAPDLGFALVSDLPELCAVFRQTYACWASDRYTTHRLGTDRSATTPAHGHDSLRSAAELARAHNTLRTAAHPARAHNTLRTAADPARPHDRHRRRPCDPVAAAVASANEQILGAPGLPISDPVYRLHARITARTVRAQRLGADDLTPEPVPGPLDPARLPAYAGIVRHNAGTPIVAALAGRVLADATDHADPESLLILADAGYGDPHPLLDSPGEITPGEITPELCTLLFRHRPGDAARYLSTAAIRDWSLAAAILEHAAAELLDLSGPRIAIDLHTAVVHAFTCAAPPGTPPPDVIDGTLPEART